ncbi:MAG: NUDIX domain-containing protein [Candidatus Micrarchaeota archaeon]|nr:NUDIX domain-containing protein [Candidatus Micrarchaeota archaeon]
MVFCIENNGIEVLALVQNNDRGEEWFDMPKGHVEKGETLVQAANREIREEIGLPLPLDTNFQEENVYTLANRDVKNRHYTRINKRVVFFLAFMHKNERKQIVLSPEHKRYYFMPIEEAVKRSRFENQRQLLKDAKAYITEKYLT